LETIDKQRRRAADARDLIRFYLDFNKEGSQLLEEFRRKGPDEEFKVIFLNFAFYNDLTAITSDRYDY
jgi:hypothetical protein